MGMQAARYGASSLAPDVNFSRPRFWVADLAFLLHEIASNHGCHFFLPRPPHRPFRI